MILVEYAFYLFFALFPLLNYQSFLYGGSATRSVNLIFLTSMLGIALALNLWRRRVDLVVPRSPIFLFLILYLVSTSISAIAGLNPDLSFWSAATRTTGLWYFLNLGLFMYLLWLIFGGDVKKQNRLILVTLLGAALYSLLSLAGPEGLGLIFKTYRGDAFTFGNSSFAGMYLFGTFLLAVYYAVQAKAKRWWLYLLPILIIINPNFLAQGIWFGNFTGSWLGEARASAYVTVLAISFLLVAWLLAKIKIEKRRHFAIYATIGAVVLGIILAVISLLSTNGFLHQSYLRQATAIRPLTWEIAGRAISQRPILGWGLDNFERVFEKNYDNRILENRYGSEAWLDRAHNVVLDQLVDNGALGLTLYVLGYLVIIGSLVYVVIIGRRREDRILATVLIIYFPLHFLELQTAFDTSVSYPMLALLVALAVGLFARTRKDLNFEACWQLGTPVKYLASLVLIGLSLWSLIGGLVPFLQTQFANGELRAVARADKRIPLYPELLRSKLDQHAFLWRLSTDFQRGISENTKVLDDPAQVEILRQELVAMEEAYQDYISNNPTHFRARLNLADILIYQRLFGVDKLEEAQTVLDEAIQMVPQSPQPYWMKAVAYIYMGKFNLAREAAKKGLALNPDIEQSQEIVKYVEDSIKTFPEIDLFFFNRI